MRASESLDYNIYNITTYYVNVCFFYVFMKILIVRINLDKITFGVTLE